MWSKLALAAALALLLLWLVSPREPEAHSKKPDKERRCLEWLEDCKPWHVCNSTEAAAESNSTVTPTHISVMERQYVLRGGCNGDPVTGVGSGGGLRVLVVHEQQPQALGCDRRLLALMRLLDSQHSRVSLLYRHGVPPSMQSPPTAELADALGIDAFDAAQIGGCLRPPPALYEYTSRAQLEALFAKGWFELVLVTTWFWNDPQVAPQFFGAIRQRDYASAQFGAQFSDRLCSCAAAVVRRAHAAAAARRRARRLPALRRAARRRRSRTARAAARSPRERRCREGGLRGSSSRACAAAARAVRDG